MLLAHAFGKRYELPIPLVYFVLGAALVVFLPFLIVLPRRIVAQVPDAAAEERGASLQRGRVAPALGVAALGALVAAGLFGSQTVAENILPTVFWLVIWIAVPLSCGLLGDWTRPVNPFAALARLADRPALRRLLFGSERPVAWPAWLGWWPATLAFFATACGELVFNQSATLPRVTAWGLLGWAALSLVAGLFFGAAPWVARGELLSVLFATWGRLGRFRFGAPGRPAFAGGLDEDFEAVPSRMAFVLLLLVSVSFDGLLATPLWARTRLDLLHAATASATAVQWETLAVFALLGVGTWLVLGAFAHAVAHLGGHGVRPAAALHGLLPSLLPIAFGYLLAHNLQYLLINGQLLVPLLGNPTGLDGGQWLPAPFDDSFEPHTHLLPSSFFWYVAVAVIVLVHVAAVVIAHGHLVRRGRDERAAKASEWPWIVAMVAYTMVSLVLMAQPLVKEAPTAPGRSAAAPNTPVPAPPGQAVPALLGQVLGPEVKR